MQPFYFVALLSQLIALGVCQDGGNGYNYDVPDNQLEIVRPNDSPGADQSGQVEVQQQGDGDHHHHHHDSDDPLAWLRDAIPGEPDVDYPILNQVPETSFTCAGREDGIYADVEARCQAWHQCYASGHWSFLCPNGTIFNQEIFTCVWWFDFECETAEQFYSLNENLYITPTGGDNDGLPLEAEENAISPNRAPVLRQPEEKAQRKRPEPTPKQQRRPAKTTAAPTRRPAPAARPERPSSPPRYLAPSAAPQQPRKPQRQPAVTTRRPTAPTTTATQPPRRYLSPAVEPQQPAVPARRRPSPPVATPTPSVPTPASPTAYPASPNGINNDYDDAAEEGYNYRVPENPLIIERPSRPKPATEKPVAVEEPLSFYGAPPLSFPSEPEVLNLELPPPPPPPSDLIEPLTGYSFGRQGRQLTNRKRSKSRSRK